MSVAFAGIPALVSLFLTFNSPLKTQNVYSKASTIIRILWVFPYRVHMGLREIRIEG